MIKITINAAAYEALWLAPPAGRKQAGHDLWLDRRTLNRLTKARGPGESYSDAIVRLAAEERAFKAGGRGVGWYEP